MTTLGSGHRVRSLIYDNLSDTGNLSGDGTFTYQYNHRNRLVGVKQDAASVADYGLNALGQRVSKTVRRHHAFPLWPG